MIRNLFIITLTFLISTPVFADKVEPPKDSVAFRGSHYKAFLDTNSTWWEAKFACDDIGGELCYIFLKKMNLFAGWQKTIWYG